MRQKDFEKFISDLKAIKLSMSEKDDIKKRIVSEIETTAFELPAEVKPIVSPYVFKNFFHAKFAFASALALVFVLTGGSVLAAANNTVPGDLLYPIKISVNEKISGIVALSPETQARRQANLIGERLKEAQILAAKGNLVPENRKIIEESIEKHSEQVKSYIKAFEDEDNLEQAQTIKNYLELSIKTNDKIISSIGEALGTEVEPVAMKLKEDFLNSNDYSQPTSLAPESVVSDTPIVATEMVVTSQGGQDISEDTVLPTDTQFQTSPALEKTMQSAESVQVKLKQSGKSIEEVENLINKSNFSFKDAFLTRLLEVRENYEEAEERFDTGLLSEAAIILDGVLQDSEELKILLKAAKTLNIPIIPGDTKSNTLDMVQKVLGVDTRSDIR